MFYEWQQQSPALVLLKKQDDLKTIFDLMEMDVVQNQIVPDNIDTIEYLSVTEKKI